MKQTKEEKPKENHPEIKGLLLLSLSCFICLSLLSFHFGLPRENWFGLLGYYTAYAFLYLLGLSSYLLLAYGLWIGWKLLLLLHIEGLKSKTLYFFLFLLSFSLLLNLFAETHEISNSIIQSHVHRETFSSGFPYFHQVHRYNLGGSLLYYLYRDLPLLNLQKLLSNLGVFLTFSTTGVISFILFSNARLVPLLKKGSHFVTEVKNFLLHVIADLKAEKVEKKEDPLPVGDGWQHRVPEKKDLFLLSEEEEEVMLEGAETPPSLESIPPKKVLPVPTNLDKKKGEEKGTHEIPKYKGECKHYRLPPLSLLTDAKKIDQPMLKKDLQKQAQLLEETLLSFGIEAKVGQINCGPTITSFEVHPPIGVKVQKIKVLENDIALNLQAKSIRIIAPIPGRAAVGVEIPSSCPQEVGFKEMLMEYQKKGKKLHIPILLGQKVTGESVMGDLTKMPHCIIAGATGSGKSVCINSIVMSILMMTRPDEIRLLLVDPKKVELSSYTRLPHMIAPVITEPHGAYSALNWLVKEMQERYEILKHLQLRNILSFNHRKRDEEMEMQYGKEIPKKMPYIVAIIDEFADLMMASSSDLETPIARIAQMARAVGIHLILATQRPSREVITGLIKANFPTRIAFKVSSRINSQIILDENGAETLLGNGDLLFMPPGSSQLIRAQGVYIRDEDINRVIGFIEEQAGTQYLIRSFDHLASEEQDVEGGGEYKDDLYAKAYQMVVVTKTASTTFLQRKLKIGYARAASLIDELEANGVISPQDGSRPRRVLVDPATP